MCVLRRYTLILSFYQRHAYTDCREHWWSWDAEWQGKHSQSQDSLSSEYLADIDPRYIFLSNVHRENQNAQIRQRDRLKAHTVLADSSPGRAVPHGRRELGNRRWNITNSIFSSMYRRTSSWSTGSGIYNQENGKRTKQNEAEERE